MQNHSDETIECVPLQRFYVRPALVEYNLEIIKRKIEKLIEKENLTTNNFYEECNIDLKTGLLLLFIYLFIIQNTVTTYRHRANRRSSHRNISPNSNGYYVHHLVTTNVLCLHKRQH
jgi:hypothetical protein